MLLVPMATPREPKAMSFWRDEQLVRIGGTPPDVLPQGGTSDLLNCSLMGGEGSVTLLHGLKCFAYPSVGLLPIW